MQMQGGHAAHTRERVGAMGFLGPARIINDQLSAQCGFVIPAPRRECASVQAEQDIAHLCDLLSRPVLEQRQQVYRNLLRRRRCRRRPRRVLHRRQLLVLGSRLC